MMLPWITSRSFLLDFNPQWVKSQGENEWSLGRVSVETGKLHAELNRLIEELNRDQWEIKMITPLEKGVTYHEQQRVVQAAMRRSSETVIGGFGLGWGSQITSGFLVIAQRTEYLTQKEYIERRNALIETQNSEPSKQESIRTSYIQHQAHEEIIQVQAQLSALKASDAIQLRKTKILRGEKYIFEGVEYGSLIEAERKRMAKISDLEVRLEGLFTTIKVLP